MKRVIAFTVIVILAIFTAHTTNADLADGGPTLPTEEVVSTYTETFAEAYGEYIKVLFSENLHPDKKLERLNLLKPVVNGKALVILSQARLIKRIGQRPKSTRESEERIIFLFSALQDNTIKALRDAGLNLPDPPEGYKRRIDMRDAVRNIEEMNSDLGETAESLRDLGLGIGKGMKPEPDKPTDFLQIYLESVNRLMAGLGINSDQEERHDST